MGVIWGVRVTQGHQQMQQCHRFMEHDDFLFTFHRNRLCFVLFCPRFGELFGEIRNFFPTRRVFGAPGVTRLEFYEDLWLQQIVLHVDPAYVPEALIA